MAVKRFSQLIVKIFNFMAEAIDIYIVIAKPVHFRKFHNLASSIKGLLNARPKNNLKLTKSKQNKI